MNALILGLAFCTLGTVSAQQPAKLDLRTNKCWPPVAPVPETVQSLQNPGQPCLIFARPLSAVTIAEYINCTTSKPQVLRSFSRLQVLECALPKLTSCGSLPASKPISGMDYVINVGLELESVYAAKHAVAHAFGETYHFNGTGSVFKLMPAVTMLPRSENSIFSALSNGPVVVNLYMNSTRAFSVNTNDPATLLNYAGGILNTDYLCPAKSAMEALKIDPVKGIEAVKVPATIVGYTQIANGCSQVDVWIGRIDIFGPNWGDKGYFYMKRNINACNIGANPIQFL